MLFCCLLIFFKSSFEKINFYENFFQEYSQSVKQFGSRSARLVSGLIWVQTVCKGYQQTALVGKDIIGCINTLSKVKQHNYGKKSVYAIDQTRLILNKPFFFFLFFLPFSWLLFSLMFLGWGGGRG